jgi:hypothetical protein
MNSSLGVVEREVSDGFPGKRDPAEITSLVRRTYDSRKEMP